MKLTPLDIKKQEFKKVLRGYDPVEVDTFMEMMANEFEELLKEHKEARDKSFEFETQLKDYRQIEKTLQQTLLQAQETTGKTYESARREGDLIIREAQMTAAKMVDQSKAELSKLNNEISQLKARKDLLIGRLRVLLSSELDLLKTLEVSGDAITHANTSQGTGKKSLELEEIFKHIDDDGATHTH
jgi:cell division initiation protein